RFIGPVPADDFREFLSRRFAQSGFSVTAGVGDQAVQLILDLAEEVPYNVQMLASHLLGPAQGRQGVAGASVEPISRRGVPGACGSAVRSLLYATMERFDGDPTKDAGRGHRGTRGQLAIDEGGSSGRHGTLHGASLAPGANGARHPAGGRTSGQRADALRGSLLRSVD